MKDFIIRHSMWLELAFILLIGLIPLLWYKEGHIALGHDMGFPLAPFDYFKDRLFTWSFRIAPFGANQTDSINGFFIHGIEGLFSYLGFSLVVTQQLTFIFWFVLPGITMYIFLKSLYPKKEDFVIRLSGSSFYMMNHYLLQAWMIAERTKFSMVAALPLIVLFTINVLYKKKSILQNAILVAITLFFLNGGAGIPLYGGVAIAVFGTVVGLLVMRRERLFETILRALKFFVLSSMFVVMINIYWIFPYVSSFAQNYTERVSATGGGAGAAEWSWEISKYASYINLLRLQGIPDWYANQDHPYSKVFLNNSGLLFLSIVFPILAIFGIIPQKKEDRSARLYKYCFFIILLFSIPFAAGSHPPFGKLYDALLKYLPGFSIFRTPLYKFGMALWFSYACLIALGLKQTITLLNNHYKNMSLVKLGLIVFGIFIVLLSAYNYPLFNGVFFNWSKNYSTMVKVPDYVFDVKQSLDGNKFSTRKLVVPELNGGNGYVIHEWRYFSLSPIPEMLSRRPVISNNISLNMSERNLLDISYDQIRTTGSSSLLSFLGVDSVLLMNDMKAPQNMSFSTVPLIKSVRESQAFTHESTFGKWELYAFQKDAVFPLIYSPSRLSYVNSSAKDIGLIADVVPISSGSAFILDEKKEGTEDLIKQFPYTKYISQGNCENCNDGFTYQIPKIVPRIMPGSRLYPLVEFFNKRKLASITEPTHKIDFILGNIAKQAAAADLMVHQEKNDKIIHEIINKWRDDFSQIASLYVSIQNEKTKGENSVKIYEYLRYLAQKSKEWEYYKADKANKLVFQSFNTYTKQYIQAQNFSPREKLPDSVPMMYKLIIPKDGRYQLFVTGNGGINDPIFLTVNGSQASIPLISTNVPAANTEPILFKKGEHTINLSGWSRNFVTTKIVPNIKFVIEPGSVKCQSLPLSKPIHGVPQKITFQYDQSLQDVLSATVHENNSQFKNKTALEFVSYVTDSDNSNVQRTVEYFPSKYVETANLTICVDSYNPRTIYATVRNIDFKILLDPPHIIAVSQDFSSQIQEVKIDFVALNQANFLVKVRKSTSPVVINFNARYDDNWKVREVSLEETNPYFRGNSKKYFDGTVTEFARRDTHMMTDVLFKSEDSIASSTHIKSNAIANMWILNGGANETDRVFLIEYQMQNRLYKTGIISVIVFFILITIYFISRKYGKN